MAGIMRATLRRAALAPLAGATTALAGIGRAGADHGNLPPIVKLSPVAVGVIAGALALAVGLAVVAIGMLLAKKRRSPE